MEDAVPVGPFTLVVIYLTTWWIVLFAVLPLGSSRQVETPPTDGSQWGAPDKPNLKKKFITTTWVSVIVWALIVALIWSGKVPLPDFSRMAPL